jgi:hypothetical protein
MGAPVEVSNSVICNWPFLMRTIVVTSGNTATAYTHGEDRSPDVAWAVCDTASTMDAAYTLDKDTSATTLTWDFNDDGNDTWVVYLLWLDQASGGIS